MAHAHIYVINSVSVECRIPLNPECSGAEVVAFPCQVGVYEPGSTRSVSGAHKRNLAAVMPASCRHVLHAIVKRKKSLTA